MSFVSSQIDDRWAGQWKIKQCQNPPWKTSQLWSSNHCPKRCCKVLFWSFQSPAIFYWRLTTLLFCLTEKDGGNIGLFQDNGLSAFNEKPQEIEKIRRELCKIFWDNNLKITVKANIAKVNFLYVTLGLKAGKPYPYNKGNILLYVHKRSVTVCQNLMTNITLIILLCETMDWYSLRSDKNDFQSWALNDVIIFGLQRKL